MSWFSWLRGKSGNQTQQPPEVTPKTEAPPPPQKKLYDDLQQQLWEAESSAAMRSLISLKTDQEITTLVNALAFAEFPLNALAAGGRSLDKRSTLTVHFVYQLIKQGKKAQADQLLTKILEKMRAKLATGAREGGAVPPEREQAFESAFAAGAMGSATEVLKQHRSTDFWRIDEILKQELYDLSMEMLKKDKPKEAAILLDAIMLDYPQDLDTEFWRVAAYNNMFIKDRSNSQTKEKAKQAIDSFLKKAEGNSRFTGKCADLRKLMSDY